MVTTSVVSKSMLAIALKEWAAICQALATGRQIVLLRKGGVDEATGAFRLEQPKFWLYPTQLHQQEQGVVAEAAAWTGPEAIPVGEPRQVLLTAWAEVVDAAWIDREESALRLAPCHFWTEETIRKRFAYRRPGLQALIVRVRTVAQPRRVAETAKHQGCRSWVELDEGLPTDESTTVLDAAEFLARADALRALLR